MTAHIHSNSPVVSSKVPSWAPSIIPTHTDCHASESYLHSPQLERETRPNLLHTSQHKRQQQAQAQREPGVLFAFRRRTGTWCKEFFFVLRMIVRRDLMRELRMIARHDLMGCSVKRFPKVEIKMKIRRTLQGLCQPMMPEEDEISLVVEGYDTTPSVPE